MNRKQTESTAKRCTLIGSDINASAGQSFTLNLNQAAKAGDSITLSVSYSGGDGSASSNGWSLTVHATDFVAASARQTCAAGRFGFNQQAANGNYLSANA